MAHRTPRLWLAVPVLVLISSVLALPGCTGGFAIARHDRLNLPGMAWFAPETASDREVLARWSAAVGPPVTRNLPASALSSSDTLRVISWNTALGAGDVLRLVADVRAESPQADLVLLLQEVYRGGPEVPGHLGSDIRYAGRLGDRTRRRHEIEDVAAATGLNLYYVPSMRNGSPLDSDEDRGNAILSTLPLNELAAVELPFERQRRVAVAATISGRSSEGRPWRLRIVSSHLDNMVGLRRGWLIGAEYARIRQARALLHYLRGETAVVLGGDFNTWFGFGERTYTEILRLFPESDPQDRQPTFMGLMRLDHLFFRLPDGWEGRFRRAAERYGSDHYPLVATLRLVS